MKWLQNYTKYLRPEEVPQLLIRPFWLSYYRSFLLCMFIMASDLFFLYPFLALGKIGLLIFLIIIFLVVIILIRIFFLINTNWAMVTGSRLIDRHQTKIFTKTITECRLRQITNIHWKQKGILSTFLNLGTIIIEVFGWQGKIELTRINNPREICDQLQKILVKCDSEKNRQEVLLWSNV